MLVGARFGVALDHFPDGSLGLPSEVSRRLVDVTSYVTTPGGRRKNESKGSSLK